MFSGIVSVAGAKGMVSRPRRGLTRRTSGGPLGAAVLAVMLLFAIGCSDLDTVEIVNSCNAPIAVIVDNKVVTVPAASSRSFDLYAPNQPTILTASTTVLLPLQPVGGGRYRAEPSTNQCPTGSSGMTVVLDSVADGDEVSQVRLRVLAADVDLTVAAKTLAPLAPDLSQRTLLTPGELDFRFTGGPPQGVGRRSVSVDLTDAVDSVLSLTRGDRRVVDCTAYPCATRALHEDGTLAEALLVRARTPGSLSDSSTFQTIIGLFALTLVVATALTIILKLRRRHRRSAGTAPLA